MASTEAAVRKIRTPHDEPVQENVWHEDFAKVQKYATDHKIPMLAVWSNGDRCSHCINFNKCILDETFQKWQKTSGVVYWIGFGDDDYTPNRHGGEGYKFAKDKKLTKYPFVRLYWKEGKVDVAMSGDDWDGGSSKGAQTLVNNLKKYLKGYTPGSGCPGCDDEDVPEVKAPALGYVKNAGISKKYTLTVDGKKATSLTLDVAKAVVAKYNSCKD